MAAAQRWHKPVRRPGSFFRIEATFIDVVLCLKRADLGLPRKALLDVLCYLAPDASRARSHLFAADDAAAAAVERVVDKAWARILVWGGGGRQRAPAPAKKKATAAELAHFRVFAAHRPG